jgi:hypothetical protein
MLREHKYCELYLGKTLSWGLLWQLSIKEVLRMMQRIDDILLKIIGEKEPVSEFELNKKYGFPKRHAFLAEKVFIGDLFKDQ